MTSSNIKTQWFFPTNHENLKSILSYGLLCGSVAHKKYYTDISSRKEHHGFIPVFSDSSKELYAAINIAIEERGDLIPCLLEIDIQQCQEEVETAGGVISLVAPLPISCVKKVVFRTKSDIDNFKSRTFGGSGGIPNIKAVKLESRSKSFCEPKTIKPKKSNPPSLYETQKIEPNSSHVIDREDSRIQAVKANPLKPVDYQKVLSYGGMICMLFYFAKNGSKSDTEFKKIAKEMGEPIFSNEKNSPSDLSLAIRSFYHNKENKSAFVSPSITIISAIISLLCKEKNTSDQRTAILEILRGDLIQGDANKERSVTLSNTLEDFYNKKIDKKTSIIYEEASSALEKQLLYLFQKDMPQKVTDEKFSMLGLEEEEVFLAGMLAGSRFGFNKIHNELRQYEGLYHYVSYAMAKYAHEYNNYGIKFKEVRPPKTVFDMIKPSVGSTSGKKLDFLKWFTKKYNMMSCYRSNLTGSSFKNFRDELESILFEKLVRQVAKMLPSFNWGAEGVKNETEVTVEGFLESKSTIIEDRYFEKMRDIPIYQEDYADMLKKCK